MKLWKFVGIVIDIVLFMIFSVILGEIWNFVGKPDLIFYIAFAIGMIGFIYFVNSLSKDNNLGAKISKKIVKDHDKMISIKQIVIFIIVVGVIGNIIKLLLHLL